MTDQEGDFLEQYRTIIFYPENNQEECMELVKRFHEGELPTSQADNAEEGFTIEEQKEYTITGSDLVEKAGDSIPHVWWPFFPTTGLVGVTGASEAGKSTFARQLALAICNGDRTFLNRPINPRFRSTIYISTEDGEESMGVMIKKQTATKYKDGLPRFRAGMNIEKIIPYLTKELKRQGADLVVIDVWSDLYGENPNDFSKVRKDLNKYSNLARLFHTCICIVHHNTKHSKDNEPSKTNLNGSQAIGAKLRTLLELRVNSNNVRQLSVVKGNYVPFDLKKKRLMLLQDKDLNLQFMSGEEAEDSIRKENKSDDEEVKNRAIKLYTEDGLAQHKIQLQLKAEFEDRAPAYGTLNAMLKGYKKGQSKKS